MIRIKNYIRYIGFYPIIFALAMIAKTLGFLPGPVDSISYIVLIIAVISLLSTPERLDRLIFSFLCYIPISILIDQPSEIFRSWLRFLLFVLLLIAVSPLLLNKRAISFRSRTLSVTLIMCVIVSIASFFCYFLGINYMDLNNIDYRLRSEGTFGGLMVHSMLLGPTSGIASLTCLTRALITSKRKYWIFFALCFGSLLFAASRSALFATIGGIIIVLYYFSNERSKIIRRIIPFVILAFVSYPLWEDALDGMNKKNKGEITEGVDYSSREMKWNIRLLEFEQNPIFGIGFVSVSEDDAYDPISGTIEPGSSWLAIMSMTGIIGLIFFVMIFYRGLKRTIFSGRSPDRALLGALLVFCGLHMIAEGHIFSAGSFLCYMVWLIIGCCSCYSRSDIDSHLIF